MVRSFFLCVSFTQHINADSDVIVHIETSKTLNSLASADNIHILTLDNIPAVSNLLHTLIIQPYHLTFDYACCALHELILKEKDVQNVGAAFLKV